MLASCDLGTATGRRDRAVLLLLARLGLRAGEVAGLGLDDVDWRRGEITVCGKRGRRDRLPLPSMWARRSSPTCARPSGGRAGPDGVRRAPRHPPGTDLPTGSPRSSRSPPPADPRPVRAHRLRHSAATAMLRAGGSLTEIGQALRHVRPVTTAIYAEGRGRALRPLARPWPAKAVTA